MDSKDEARLAREKKWSVMVYMAGDNNLSEEMVWALQEMNEYFTNTESTKVNLSAQFDGMGAYPRRYRFRPGGASPVVGESDGNLRRYRNENPPLGGRVSEDLILAGNLRDQELDSIGRIALDKAHQPGEFPAALDDAHVSIFRGIPNEVEQGPSRVLAGHFPLGAHTAPDRNEVRVALESKLRFAANYLLDDVAVNAQLQDFVIQMVGEHDAEDLLAVILSGHGNGAFGDFLPDEDPNSSLSIPDIGTFVRLLRIALYLAGGGPPIIGNEPVIENKDELNEFPKIHILGMDSCLMSTLEVCYEVRKHAKFLIGAEGFVPLSGWPYQRVLKALDDNVSGTEEDVVLGAVNEIVGRYDRYYSDYEDAGVSTDLSAIDLLEIQNVVDQLDALVRELSAPLNHLMGSRTHDGPPDSIQFAPENQPLDELDELGLNPPVPANYDPENGRIVRNALILARWYAQSYQWENQVDIWDFCDQLRRFLPFDRRFGELHGLCDEVKGAVVAAVRSNRWSGTEFQHSHGLSVYFPFSAEQYAPEYYDEHWDEEAREVVADGISFACESLWGSFLRKFLRLTRRVRRNQIDHLNPEDEFNSFRRQGLQEDPLELSAFSNYRVRSGGPFNTRSGGPFNTRSGGPFNTRSGGPFNTKGISSMAKNLPDGYYPENGRDRDGE